MAKQEQPKQRLYDLVVMGASAGGIEALSVLASTLPETLPVPIVIAQHLDPNVPSHLGQILSRRSKLSVRTVARDLPERLEGGVIYVVPSDRDVEIIDGTVRLRETITPHPTPSIDRLFTSAAKVYGERVIAVILTGSGSDGAAGARVVKAAGGAVIIENPATASYPMMPAALAPTTVDLIVDLDRMGALIADLISGAKDLATPGGTDTLGALLERVREHTGIDFSQYKTPTILRRLHRRMAATNSDMLADYMRLLDQRPEEYQRLVSSFLINVTEFFRDEQLFTFLREQVIPEMIAQARGHGNEIRVWSAGCATGEEAYSIAILLAEALGVEALQFGIRIFATDVDSDSIAFARRGFYPAPAITGMPPELRARYFTPVEDGYEITKFIRNMVVFGEHDLGQRAPFPHMDMVICRNVLIYFTTELQTHVLQLFAYSLRDGGYLVLGNAESATMLGAYFASVHPPFKVYRRQGERVLVPPMPIGGRGGYETPPVLTEAAPHVPAAGKPRQAPTGAQAMLTLPMEAEVFAHEVGQRTYSSRERFADQILSLPMGVIVIDRNYDVQTINSAAYALLDIHRPAIGKDLLHLATRVPTRQLRSAIDLAFQSSGATEAQGGEPITVDLEQNEDGDKRRLQITCYPHTRSGITNDGGASSSVEAVLLFISEVAREEAEPGASAVQGAEAPPEGAQAETAAQLRKRLETERALGRELRVANQELREENDTLRRANEDLVVSQEEVQASTEETITFNEEMQATNEELETLNEELEATVEELHTTNDDLLARSQELQTLAEEKDAQRKSSERERAQLKAVLSSMGDAVIAVGADGKTVLTNAAYQNLFGDGSEQLALEDSAGKPMRPEAAPWRRAGEGEPFTTAFTVRTPEGERRWFEASGQPLRIGDQQVGGVVTIRDLSDRTLRALYERFLGRVSHELRNPLAALMITIDLMRKQPPGRDAEQKLRDLAEKAQRHTRRLNVLIGDLADLEQVRHDKLALKMEPVDLRTAVQQAIDDIEFIQTPEEPHPPIVLRAQPGAAPIVVLGDASRIEQVAQNLLANALKYAPESDRVDVRIRRVHEQGALEVAELEVQDYGRGIAASDLPHIYTPFYQAADRYRPRQSGLGLGLYIVQQIVTAMGGLIEARSSEGRGTIFTVRLPLFAEGAQVTPVAGATSQEASEDSRDGD